MQEGPLRVAIGACLGACASSWSGHGDLQLSLLHKTPEISFELRVAITETMPASLMNVSSRFFTDDVLTLICKQIELLPDQGDNASHSSLYEILS